MRATPAGACCPSSLPSGCGESWCASWIRTGSFRHMESVRSRDGIATIHWRSTSAATWHDLIPFHEYFNGETGAGIGAAHQTGWTGLVGDLLIRLNRRSGPTRAASQDGDMTP